MERACQIAQLGHGLTGSNPLVGCVIVYQNQIVAEGYHHQYGGPHAEVVAINRLNDSIPVSECYVYVTLEPCAHYGKTPPCAQRIIEHQFKKVVVAAVDPNPLVAGKGIKMMQDAGISVIVGVHEQKAKHLNRRFLVNQLEKRTFCVAKWAVTADGWMGENSGKSLPISGPESQVMVHQLRAEHPAIMIGVNTWINDQPQLNTRKVNGPNPSIFVIDPSLRVQYPESNNIHIFSCLPSNDSRVITMPEISPKEILRKMYHMGYSSVLLEGGAKTLEFFQQAQMIDAWYRIESKKTITPKSDKLVKEPEGIAQISAETFSFSIGNDLWQGGYL